MRAWYHLAMEDWNWVTNRVAIGSAPRAADVPEMVRQGITDVLDLRGEPRANETGPHPEMYAGTGIDYHYVGMLDRGTTIPAAKYADAVQVIYNALAKPNGKILVHCAAGQNRSPSVVYAYLLSTGMSPSDAWDLIRAHRTIATRQYFNGAQSALAVLPRGPNDYDLPLWPLIIALGAWWLVR